MNLASAGQRPVGAQPGHPSDNRHMVDHGLDGGSTKTDHEFQQFAALLQPQHGVRGAFDILNHTLSIHNH